MVTIRLSEAINFSDIARWGDHGGEQIEFIVTPSARFVLLAEGLAIGKLGDLRARGISFSVKLAFLVTSSESPWLAISRSDCLSGIFGLGLLLGAESVTDASHSPVKDLLRTAFWDYITSHSGVIGDGKRVSIIAREPNTPLAECLLESDQLDFPGPAKFVELLKTIVQELGAGQTFEFSVSELSIATFLYEAARNSWEHGRHGEDGRIARGARGILVEKVMITNDEELAVRQDIPEFIRNYLREVRNTAGKRRRFAVAFTVADYGRGIHRTLPPLEGESAWNRLLRAFEPNQSRKPPGVDLNWGQGLPNILDVCRPPLAAFLFVRSSELVGYADFSHSREGLPLLTELPSVSATGSGTSLTVLWLLAGRGATHDQPTLL